MRFLGDISVTRNYIEYGGEGGCKLSQTSDPIDSQIITKSMKSFFFCCKPTNKDINGIDCAGISFLSTSSTPTKPPTCQQNTAYAMQLAVIVLCKSRSERLQQPPPPVVAAHITCLTSLETEMKNLNQNEFIAVNSSFFKKNNMIKNKDCLKVIVWSKTEGEQNKCVAELQRAPYLP